jgi:hypothetical protein
MSNGKVTSPPEPALPGVPSPPPPTSTPSPTLTAQIVFDEPSIKDLAREANQKNPGGKPVPWAGDHVDYEAGASPRSENIPADGIVRIGAQVPSPLSPSFPPANPTPTGMTVTVKKAQRLGSYSVPIVWKLDGTTSATLTPASPSMKVEINGRVRLSAWATPNNFWVDSSGKTKKFARDRWKAIDDRWGLDDITFTQTVRLLDPAASPPMGAPLNSGKPDPEAVWWASNFLPSLSDQEREDWMRDAIQFFHAHNIQVFVGYEIVTQDWTTLVPPDPKQVTDKDEFDRKLKYYNALVADMNRNRSLGNAFVRWLEAKGDKMSNFEEHAKKLVGFFDNRGLDIDGISYDLEIDGKNNGVGLASKHTSAIQALYMAVMLQLSAKERYLAFAAGGGEAGQHDHAGAALHSRKHHQYPRADDVLRPRWNRKPLQGSGAHRRLLSPEAQHAPFAPPDRPDHTGGATREDLGGRREKGVPDLSELSRRAHPLVPGGESGGAEQGLRPGAVQRLRPGPQLECPGTRNGRTAPARPTRSAETQGLR